MVGLRLITSKVNRLLLLTCERATSLPFISSFTFHNKSGVSRMNFEAQYGLLSAHICLCLEPIFKAVKKTFPRCMNQTDG